MRQITVFLIVCICTIVFFTACGHSYKTNDKIYNIKQVDSLINTGPKYLNNNLDSLIITAKKLSGVAALNDNKKALVYGELYTAQYYWLTADHKTAMQIAVKCLSNIQKWNIYEAYPSIYSIMGNLHKETTDYTLAFEDADKGLRWAKANKDTNGLISMLSLKAMFLHTHALASHIALNDSSINLQSSALKIARSKYKFEQLEIALDDNIAQYYFDNGKYQNAIYYGEQGANLAIKYNRKRSLTYSYIWLGYSWYKTGDKQKGLDYINNALQIAHALKQPYREMEIHQDLYNFYSNIGDYKEAIAQNNRYQQMHDSLRVNMNARQVGELQIKYESSEKDVEIARISHAKRIENKQILIISAITVLFIFFFIILFLQYRLIWHNNRNIKQSNEKKDKALVDIAYIQSHELRKPLASILGLINVIRSSDGIVDQESLNKLEEAGKDLDQKIHDIISNINQAE